MPVSGVSDLLDGQLYFPGQEALLNGVLTSVVNTAFNRQNAVIPFGLGVARGANDKEIILPVDANSVFRGITKLMQIEKRPGYSTDSAGRFGVPIAHECAVLEAGVIGVFIDGAVTEGGSVHWNHTASTSFVGAFRGAANGANTTLITGATWLRSMSGATPADMKVGLLRLNRP